MKRIKYVSQFARDLTRDEIDTLVERAAAKNATLDLTGILMTSGRLFFQVLEGPTAHVDQVYQSIVEDDRHRDVLLLETEHGVSERFFPDWRMRMIEIDPHSDERLEPARAMLENILTRRREVDRLTGNLERIIWRELAATLDGDPSR